MGRATAAHLLRRAGFGATPDALDEWSGGPLVEAVEWLVEPGRDAAMEAIEAPVFHPAEQIGARGGTSPVDAVAVGNRRPLVARGERRSAAVVPVGPCTRPGDDALRRGLVTLAQGADETGGLLLGAVAASTADLLEVVDRLPAPAAAPTTVDHGGGTLLVAGEVRGGHHGEPPSLDHLVDGDLASTVDFRSVYGELLAGVLDTEPADVLASVPALLGLLR